MLSAGTVEPNPAAGRVRPLRRLALVAALLPALAIVGCAEDSYHGYVVSDLALSQVQPGASREQVLLVLGTPSTTATLGGEAFYYISQKATRKAAFMDPSVTDRKILAVYFDEKGTVKEMGNYGLQDGKVFDYISRRTKTGGTDAGFLSQLLKAGPSIGSLTGG